MLQPQILAGVQGLLLRGPPDSRLQGDLQAPGPCSVLYTRPFHEALPTAHLSLPLGPRALCSDSSHHLWACEEPWTVRSPWLALHAQEPHLRLLPPPPVLPKSS